MGNEISKGKNTKTMDRKMLREMPKGSHRNMASVAMGVGLKAILPSWNTRGFGYRSLGKACQFLFSASVAT